MQRKFSLTFYGFNAKIKAGKSQGPGQASDYTLRDAPGPDILLPASPPLASLGRDNVK